MDQLPGGLTRGLAVRSGGADPASGPRLTVSGPPLSLWTYSYRWRDPSQRLRYLEVEVSCGDAARDLPTISALHARSSTAYASSCGYGIETDESRRSVKGKPAVAWSQSSQCHAVMWLERPGAVIKVEASEDLRAELSGVVDGIRVTG
ncbi:hypothetical protein [Nonomuraea sp. NPDC049695]|uniref:hypothetical protein n=1 Tax=Nonomuraea sp. NPDC049695 TaxID=3154734 RepID=UPI00341CC2E3